MSFSIKWLFGIVAIAAIFTAALIYPLSSWALVAVNLTVVVLAAATLGVWCQRLSRTFWLSFCFLGWLYLGIAFTPALLRLSNYLPSKQITFLVKEAELRPRFTNITDQQMVEDLRRFFDDVDNFINPFRADHPTNSLILRFRRFGDIMDALFALLAGILAGIISVLLIRQKREA